MNRIEQLRKEHGFSQQELAEKLNVHQTAVSQWEKGRTSPGFDVLCQMSALFNADPVYVMGNSVERKPFSTTGDDSYEDPNVADLGKARIIAAYERLNAAGQEEAAKRMEELAEVPKYKA